MTKTAERPYPLGPGFKTFLNVHIAELLYYEVVHSTFGLSTRMAACNCTLYKTVMDHHYGQLQMTVCKKGWQIV